MGRVAVIGERDLVTGWSLAGALVCPAEDPEQVRRAWRDLGPEVTVVILTAAADRSLGSGRVGRPLTVVIPE
ncbi:V-type ATP synthase subunit F [Stackebrandtia nassauensis]|uniref:Vacuolar H+transporting two-sector ATPase F subunit n=1 Tax=Stackebrandtia nassauensis (strain DSM 44728 / CIP 108903 / NRRL B-16338 / NBRC 102104 / LLR-40K-21) TaxID=446470 RepID=D3PVL0_STANL|nr:V-type ATP synthase subunit F [Stackebrandtia nassauensis]ADD43124.1 hypothetical protein Snas_3460 [Stackebrandtia nassauensis DSM 44728]